MSPPPASLPCRNLLGQGPECLRPEPAHTPWGAASAPRAVRGRYLAAFQYAFTVPGAVAPALVALFSVAVWLPWLLVGTCAGLAVAALRWLAVRLPADATQPESAVLRQAPASSAAIHAAFDLD